MLRTNRYATGAAAVAIAAATVVGAAGSALGTPAAGRTGLAGRAAGHLDPGLSTSGTAGVRVVVSARGGQLVAAEHAARSVHGTVRTALPLVDGFAATVPADRLRDLAAAPSVAAVTADRSAKLDDHSFDVTNTASSIVRSTGADQAWASGDYGAGVGVAVLDTGVSDVDDLAGRVIHGPDLSGEGTSVDTFGHGTVMAGIIGGDGTDSATSVAAWHRGPRDGRDVVKGSYTGVAPGVSVVAVKVAGRDASVDVSTVLQAMSWVAAYRTQFNIRVLNLSWGVPSTQDPSVDPLDYGVERLWQLGVVVVVAAGNAGPAAGTITKPADDPLAITVGALDDSGTGGPRDDTVAAWSSRGPTAAGLTKPDVIAPGRMIVATRSFGSFIEQSFPNALIGTSYIRGSGTSEATAVVSGDVALLLAKRPDLTPDQVKFLLKSTAWPLRTATPNDQGAGRVRVDAALRGDASRAPVQTSTAVGTGSIEASRAGLHVSTICNGLPTTIIGEIDVHCEPWDGTTWAGSTWSGDSWTGTTWTSDAWTTASWTGTTWTGGLWTGGAWLGTTPWTGTTWTGTTWTGTTWTGTTWTGTTWTGTTWTGTTWTGSTWSSLGLGVLLPDASSNNEFQTAFWGDGPAAGHSLPGEKSQRPDPPAVSPLFVGSLW